MLLSQECGCYPDWHDFRTGKKLGQVKRNSGQVEVKEKGHSLQTSIYFFWMVMLMIFKLEFT